MTPADDFDRWLEAELDKGYARSSVQSRMGSGGYQDVISRRRRFHPVSAAGIPFVGKAAIGLAAATLSLGAVGAAAATAVTHSVDPQAWGQQVKQAVADCKKTAKPGQHGIGECVSAFAKQHGVAKREEHAQDKQSSAADNPNDSHTAEGEKPGHPGVPPGLGSRGASDSPHGQGPPPKPEKSHGAGTVDKLKSHPTPPSH